jgi:hypothetical protein
MSQKKLLFSIGGLVVLAAAWAVFRPDLLFTDVSVNESFPEARASGETSTLLLGGEFRSGAHETKGSAGIYQLAGGKRVLRLSGFSTSNGPDLRVLLVAANDAADSDAVKTAGWVELGALKGNLGDQNYDVPASVDLSKHRAVTIWCNRFGVNFGTAPLAN